LPATERAELPLAFINRFYAAHAPGAAAVALLFTEEPGRSSPVSGSFAPQVQGGHLTHWICK